MRSKLCLVSRIILIFSSLTTAKPVFHDDLAKRQIVCPASCLMTTTVTVTALPSLETIRTGRLSASALETPSSSSSTSVPDLSTSTFTSTLSKTETITKTVGLLTGAQSQPSVLEPVIPNSEIDAGQLISLTSTPTITNQPATHCNRNNCLRHFIHHPAATSFCQTYTQTKNTATIGLPDLVSQCHYEPTRISAACSCLLTGSPTSSSTGSTSPSTTSPSRPLNSAPTTTSPNFTLILTPLPTCHQDNCLRQFLQSPTPIISFCSSYTASFNTISLTTQPTIQSNTTPLPPYASMCTNGPSQLSSACSCIHAVTPTPGSCTANIVLMTQTSTITVLVTGSASSSTTSTDTLPSTTQIFKARFPIIPDREHAHEI